MSLEDLHALVAKNPQVDQRRVTEYLRYVEGLRKSGVRIQPRYGVSHPFESNRSARIRVVVSRGDNIPMRTRAEA